LAPRQVAGSNGPKAFTDLGVPDGLRGLLDRYGEGSGGREGGCPDGLGLLVHGTLDEDEGSWSKGACSLA
jgi:hypothetical protein